MLIEYTPFTDDDGVTFEAWTDGYAVGFKVTLAFGEVRYIYLNPSSSSDDGVPNVFLYEGPAGDPSIDPALHHYDLPTDDSSDGT